MSRPQNYFTELSAVPIHYARPPVAPYATRGKPYRFYTLESFEQELIACLEELWDVCPYGKAELVTSAGAYVNKSGYHGLGRGFDIDAIFWQQREFVTLDYPSDPVFYLGVESIIRRHFGTVLSYLYNRAHRDHFHIDNGTSVNFSSSSKSRVLYVQAALSHVWEKLVMIDGIYGQQTLGAINEVLREIDSTGDIDNKQTWRKLLLATANKAFDRVVETMNPADLLRHLYTTIEDELGDTEQRKHIETVLNVFADHQDTQAWLSAFEEV